MFHSLTCFVLRFLSFHIFAFATDLSLRLTLNAWRMVCMCSCVLCVVCVCYTRAHTVSFSIVSFQVIFHCCSILVSLGVCVFVLFVYIPIN